MADEKDPVTVVLGPDGNPVTPEKVEKVEPQYVTADALEEIRKQLNGLSYIGRKFNELEQKIARVGNGQQVRTAVDPNSVDPDDVLLEKDWKAAVRKQARVEAEAMWAERQRVGEHEQAAFESRSRLEGSKKAVIDRYPDIMDNSTEIARRYTQIINGHPEYLQNDYGPVLAMRDMEEELRKEGRLDEFSKKVVDAEVQRRIRADGGGAAKGSAVGKVTKTVTLTAEQKAVADKLGVKYETYVKMLERQPKEGVEA